MAMRHHEALKAGRLVLEPDRILLHSFSEHSTQAPGLQKHATLRRADGRCQQCCDRTKLVAICPRGDVEYLLLSLLKDPKIARLYCLNCSHDARERQNKAFATLGAGDFAL